jgi:hypothetical protein
MVLQRWCSSAELPRPKSSRTCLPKTLSRSMQLYLAPVETFKSVGGPLTTPAVQTSLSPESSPAIVCLPRVCGFAAGRHPPTSRQTLPRRWIRNFSRPDCQPKKGECRCCSAPQRLALVLDISGTQLTSLFTDPRSSPSPPPTMTYTSPQYVNGIYIPSVLLLTGVAIIQRAWLPFAVAFVAIVGGWKFYSGGKETPPALASS